MSKENNANSINGKLDKLDEMIEWFNSDDFELEDAIEKYKQAEALANEVENDLNNIKNEVNILKQKFDN